MIKWFLFYLSFNPLIQGINPRGVCCNNKFVLITISFGATKEFILATSKIKRKILSQNPCSCNFHHVSPTFLVQGKCFC